MKTRLFVIAVLAMVATLFLIGCGTGRMATKINPTPSGGMEYESRGAGLIFSPSAIEMAESYWRMKQADMLTNMVAGLVQGKTVGAPTGQYIIALVNNDPEQEVYCYHPEIPGWQIIADPKGGFGFMLVKDIPIEIVIYRHDGKIVKKHNPRYDPYFSEKITHKKQVGNVLADWKITVNKVY